MRSTSDGWSADAQTCARTPYWLELGGGAREIVALVGVVLVAVVVVTVVLVIGDDGVLVVVVVFFVMIVVLFLFLFLAIVQHFGASRGYVALEFAQSEHVDTAFLTLVPGAEQQYTVLLDHVQLLDLHRLVEDQSVRETV